MKNRQFIYIPQINPHTFLFFYFVGDSGRSYSLREYPTRGNIVRTDARDYPYTADEILSMARWREDAPTHDTNDAAFWRSAIAALNRRYLLAADGAPTDSRPIDQRAMASDGQAEVDVTGMIERDQQIGTRYPMLNLERILAHPIKGTKPQDLVRILKAPRSEDYVTWNTAQLLERVPRERWWDWLLGLARRDNPRFGIHLQSDDLPAVELWRSCATPHDYEVISRVRMATSDNAEWQARSRNTRPVEGRSEIDLVLEGQGYLVFVEAKLDADISLATTYDPHRNQIIRNIDVLLEHCGGRTPAFLMLVKDADSDRMYTQLLQAYREDPRKLAAALSHRSQAAIDLVARNLAIVLWQDVFANIPEDSEGVLAELKRRVHSSL